MKKTFKILGILFGALLLLVTLAASYVHLQGIPTYEPMSPEINISPADSITLAHGKRLSVLVCAGCHQNEDGSLSGKKMLDMPTAFGEVWAQNITRHPTKGIGQYADAELVYLLRTGIKRDGSYAPMWMPKFPLMSDEDMFAIISFLRSEDRLTEPSDALQPLPQPSFLMKALTNTVMKPLPYPEQEIPAPDKNDPIAYGKYLADGVYACFVCHSADFTQLNDLAPTASAGYYGGGNLLIDPTDGSEVYTANLTPSAFGLEGWTLEEFSVATRFAQGKDGQALRLMPPHNAMTEDEVSAIYAYLKTVPAIENDISHFSMK